MSLLQTLKDLWKSLDYIPDCPECNGTGNPKDLYFTEYVWWKGEQVIVCSRCHGAGKV